MTWVFLPVIDNVIFYHLSTKPGFKKKMDLGSCTTNPTICKSERPTREDILSEVQGVDAIYWSSKYKLDKEIVDAAGPNLKVVGTLSVGYDHIDVNLLKSRNIKLGNTANVLNDSVAEMAVALCLMTSRRLVEGIDKVQKNKMVLGADDSLWLLGHQISGSVVGIIGFGRIGSEIATRLKAFKPSRIIYAGNSEKAQGKTLGAEFVTLDTLTKESDFVILSCPLNDKTRHLINADFLNKMKSTAILINISRGDVVDQDALLEALNSEKIFAAGLDVTTPEPLPPGHPLLSSPRCIITPHLGSATIKTRDEMSILTAKNILAGLSGKELPSPVF